MQQSNASTWHIMMRQCDTTNCDNATQQIATMQRNELRQCDNATPQQFATMQRNKLRHCDATNCYNAMQQIATMRHNELRQCDVTNCDNATQQIATMRHNSLRQCDSTVCQIYSSRQIVLTFFHAFPFHVSDYCVIFSSRIKIFHIFSVCGRFFHDFILFSVRILRDFCGRFLSVFSTYMYQIPLGFFQKMRWDWMLKRYRSSKSRYTISYTNWLKNFPAHGSNYAESDSVQC